MQNFQRFLNNMPTKRRLFRGKATAINWRCDIILILLWKSNSSGLRKLKALMNFPRSRCISRLENVNDVGAARDDNLYNQRNLNEVLLKWSNNFDDWRDVKTEKYMLEVLQPQPYLKKLTIKSYNGKNFPAWKRDSSISSLVLVKLKICFKCICLPAVGRLPFVKKLVIKEKVWTVGLLFHGTGCSTPFSSLETLMLWE